MWAYLCGWVPVDESLSKSFLVNQIIEISYGIYYIYSGRKVHCSVGVIIFTLSLSVSTTFDGDFATKKLNIRLTELLFYFYFGSLHF